jgi:SAM-dependent methyltransferase
MENDPHSPSLDSAFVKNTYDTLLRGLSGSYTDYRWGATPVSRFHFAQTKRALTRALTQVPHSLKRMLEVGGGGGAWTPYFAPRTEALDYLDISEEMLREARTHLAAFPQISYLHADFLAWEAPANAYDLVVMIRNIEYMPDKRAVLAKCFRALTSGGTLLLVTKNPESDWRGYYRTKRLHSGQMPLNELRARLTEAGFAGIEATPAIIGKGVRYAVVRPLWHAVQWLGLRIPLPLTRLFAESFLVLAHKP